MSEEVLRLKLSEIEVIRMKDAKSGIVTEIPIDEIGSYVKSRERELSNSVQNGLVDLASAIEALKNSDSFEFSISVTLPK